MKERPDELTRRVRCECREARLGSGWPSGVPRHLPGLYDAGTTRGVGGSASREWSSYLEVASCANLRHEDVPCARSYASSSLRTWPRLQGAYSPREKQTGKEINHVAGTVAPG